MACFHPLTAWQLDGGEVSFKERGAIRRELTLPCGQCVGCRLERSRQWAIRCLHESQLHQANQYVTLTYSDEHLPSDGGLHYPHFQKFMRRLRKEFGRVRFYMCGEYGEKLGRPHYHAILFGLHLPDLEYFRHTESGDQLYTSDSLTEVWGKGHVSVGAVTFESAAYVARYVMKKVTGPRAEEHYRRVDADTGEVFQVSPEFTRMSLKPGIGADWLAKFRTDVYPHDQVNIHGRWVRPPRFYDRQLESIDYQAFEAIQPGRYQRALSVARENTAARLQSRELVTRAKLSLKKRTIE